MNEVCEENESTALTFPGVIFYHRDENTAKMNVDFSASEGKVVYTFKVINANYIEKEGRLAAYRLIANAKLLNESSNLYELKSIK